MPKTMKQHSRKMVNSSVGSKTADSFSSTSTSAAAVSLNKFGQATFTSVRRADCENRNGNFVPLKKTKLDNEDVPKVEEPQAIPVPKPKVYKFFKSRASTQQKEEPVVNKNTTNNSQPKPLLLNTFSKQDGIKRITTINDKSYHSSTYSKIKSGKCSTVVQSPNIIGKSLNISDNRSCEIQVCGDKTIKKVISPNKTTEFIIRNNSNVRNATIKPVSTPVQILSSNRGIRASRRLKGIEPESLNSVQKTTTIHVVYDKDNSLSNSDQNDTDRDSVKNEDISNIEDSAQIDENVNTETNIKEVVSEKHIEPVLSPEDSNEKEQFEKINESNDSILNENIEEIDKKIIQNNNDGEIEIDIEKSDSFQLESNGENKESKPDLDLNSKPKNIDDQENLISDPDNSSQATKEEQNTNIANSNNNKNELIIKPKKKIFFNRDRSKVEFNTKSFFASSDMKDEFDIENKTNPTALTEKNDKKVSQDIDDDDAYVKLKRIKKAHQCHDLGETEQFDEDIKYYLSGIVSTNPNSMRCLSILGLSQQAMRPEFRMHLRAHDDMPRIIKALMDAPQDSNLALCTATLMFVYNQDRLTMDIDPNALSLMLELLETRSDECNQVEEKHRVKIVSLVEEMKNKGHAKYLKLNEITAGKLAMETLLGLTSKRAGDWFKVELRRMKGIDFIVNTVLRCAENYSEEGHMVKIDRCMHVLENVTFNNIENQDYITNYSESKFISTCITLLKNCKHKIIISNDSKIFLSAFFSILRVLTNLTSESVNGCKVVGSFDGIIDLLLECLFELPTFIMSDQRFDLMVIILCLCINLVEFCEDIRDIVINSEKYMSELSKLLFKKIEEAVQVEQQTDHLLESHETVQMTEAMQDNLLMQMISKSGTHMEHSLVSACVCLMFGCCIQDNENYRKILKDSLPNGSFEPLIEQLEKLRDFAHLADIMTQKGKDRVQKVLHLFKMYK